MEEKEDGNVYAYNIQDVIIHISQASSGRKGYYCLGCRRELQACISKIEFRASYFRHDPKGVDPNKKCIYTDETYRHKLAKYILQRTKRIKVPPVYKYPPKGQEGLANLLEEERFIYAHRVENETCFFEDDNGEIQWGKQKDVEGRNLLIQPDVTFFNEKDEPILFIELVATHGLTLEKRVKIKRLGIDTIQVRIPKESPEEIENTFLKSEKTKWIYNYEQERTEYIPVSYTNSTGVPPVDELQRSLFEETYECRAAQIKSLIRAIRKCLESKPYRDLEEQFRGELSRVERNTAANRDQLRRIQENNRAAILRRYAERRATIELEETELERAENDISREETELEADFRRKAADLDREADRLELRISTEIPNIRRNQLAYEKRRGEIKREEESININIRAAAAGIEQLQRDRNNLPAKFAQLEQSTKSQFADLENGERAAINRIEESRKQLPARFEQERARLESRYAERRTETVRRIENQDNGAGSELSGRIKKLLEAGKLLRDFEQNKATLKRNREAWQCYRTGTYKEWIKK